MKVALFVPCFVDQFDPATAWATVAVLERHGCEVVVPRGQTCCGQPLANAGYCDEAIPAAKHFLDVFDHSDEYDWIVAPSASCVAMVRKHYHDVLGDDERWRRVGPRVRELCEFLTDVLGVENIGARFGARVALHRACHGVRELGLSRPSERVAPPHDKVERLLRTVESIELVPIARSDECCGFGGSFAVKEDAVSCSMGRDKLDAAANANADVLTATDTSCLLHLDGLARRDGRPLRIVHVARILAGDDWEAPR